MRMSINLRRDLYLYSIRCQLKLTRFLPCHGRLEGTDARKRDLTPGRWIKENEAMVRTTLMLVVGMQYHM